MRIPQVFTLILCYALGHISVNYIKTKSIDNHQIINAFAQSG